LAGSVIVLVHTELHRLGIPAGHMQVPPLHIAPTPHGIPQAPQFLVSVWKLVHVPLQMSGVGAMHVPASPPLLLVLLTPPVPVPPVPAPPVPVPLLELVVPLLALVMPPLPLLALLMPPVDDDEPLAPPVAVVSPLPMVPPQPIAAACTDTAATASMSHERGFIRLLLFGPCRPAARSPSKSRPTTIRPHAGLLSRRADAP
jgi:hypothetical protein